MRSVSFTINYKLTANRDYTQRLIKISKLAAPILRYGTCGFITIMNPNGFVPISSIVQMKRFHDLNTTKECVIAIATQEKASPTPRYETDRSIALIRPTMDKNRPTSSIDVTVRNIAPINTKIQ